MYRSSLARRATPPEAGISAGWYPGRTLFMPLRVGNPRRKFLAVLSLCALQAGLAAGAVRTGAAEPPSRPAAAVRPEAPGAPSGTPTTPAAPPAPEPPAPTTAPSPAAALVPADRLYLEPILDRAAAENGLPRDLVLAQAWAESSWRVDAVSSVGALGVLQLTPSTVDFVSRNLLHLDHDLDVHDPAANARMAGVYLKHLLEHTDGDLRRALMAYNQGLR